MASDWSLDTTEDEREALSKLDVEPQFHDYSAYDVLDAYRAGYLAALRDAGDAADAASGNDYSLIFPTDR